MLFCVLVSVVTTSAINCLERSVSKMTCYVSNGTLNYYSLTYLLTWKNVVERICRCLGMLAARMGWAWGSIEISEYQGTCYSAAYMNQTHKQQHFAIFEAATNWHDAAVHYATIHYPCQ